MIKSTIVVKPLQEVGFKLGDLVGLSTTKFDDDQFYIVLFEEIISKTTFAGTVVYNGGDRSPYKIGERGASFIIDCFEKFNGVLTLECV
ncbi:hypothetical protein D3C75_772030 [compost metagenome]